MTDRLIEIRCHICNRKLGMYSEGSKAEIKCPKCGHLNRLTVTKINDRLERAKQTR